MLALHAGRGRADLGCGQQPMMASAGPSQTWCALERR